MMQGHIVEIRDCTPRNFSINTMGSYGVVAILPDLPESKVDTYKISTMVTVPKDTTVPHDHEVVIMTKAEFSRLLASLILSE